MSEQQKKQSTQEPTKESFEVDVDALIRQKKAQIQGHTWRQRGPWLVCISCDHKHSSWLGMNKELIGIDEKGEPIVRILKR